MRHNVLIVDDEQLIRQGLRARIEYLGIDVDEMFEADNGLMALGIQEEHPIDLVITDIRMPDMDGLELIQEMQKKNNQLTAPDFRIASKDLTQLLPGNHTSLPTGKKSI